VKEPVISFSRSTGTCVYM